MDYMVLPKYACWLNLIEPWRKQLKGKVGGWQLGDVDLREYLDSYRDQKLVLIITPVGRASDPTYTGECETYAAAVRQSPALRQDTPCGPG